MDAYFYAEGALCGTKKPQCRMASKTVMSEEMGYIHPKTGAFFYEIHTRLFSTESSAYSYLNRAFSDVFAHPSKVEVQGRNIFTLEETHHLFSSLSRLQTFFTAVSGSVRSVIWYR